MARSGRSRRATTKRRGRRTAATSSKFSPAVTPDAARADADRAAQIDSVLKLLAAVQQAVAAQQAYLVQFRGDVRTDLVGVQQQLVTVQELTGQSQQRLSELREALLALARQPVPALDTSGARAPGGPS